MSSGLLRKHPLCCWHHASTLSSGCTNSTRNRNTSKGGRTGLQARDQPNSRAATHCKEARRPHARTERGCYGS